VISLRGAYFDGKSARETPVRLECKGGALRLFPQDAPEEATKDARPLAQTHLAKCRIDPPLGGALRVIRLPGGAHVETEDSEGVSALERLSHQNATSRFVYAMESRWRVALAALALTAVILWGLVHYGMPVAADTIAFALPEDVLSSLGDRVLTELDERMFKPSEIEASRQEEIGKLFKDFAAQNGLEPAPKLVFRAAPSSVGPNAFALPSGIIVVTDEMVKFAASDDELLGVFAHETVHCRERHALRSMIQHAGVFVAASLALGDMTSVSTLAGALPVILIEARYSREFEEEADLGAAEAMMQAGRPVAPLVALFRRMAEKTPGAADGPDLFSSHPAFDKRIAALVDIARANGEDIR
jgi:Zn-dependent protease with chaperone function